LKKERRRRRRKGSLIVLFFFGLRVADFLYKNTGNPPFFSYKFLTGSDHCVDGGHPIITRLGSRGLVIGDAKEKEEREREKRRERKERRRRQREESAEGNRKECVTWI